MHCCMYRTLLVYGIEFYGDLSQSYRAMRDVLPSME